MQGAPNGPPPQQSQPMSRQNSVPQSVYPPQGSPPGLFCFIPFHLFYLFLLLLVEKSTFETTYLIFHISK